MEVGERGGVGSDDFDLAERGAVEQRDRLACSCGLALDGALRLVGSVPRGPQPAAIFPHLCAIGPMLGFERQAPQRIDERPPTPARDDAHRHGHERRSIGGRARFIDRAPGQGRHRGDGGDIGGLALIGRHAERGVALEVLDGDVAFARGERDILQRHVVLEIDPAPAFVVGLRPGSCDGVMTRRRVWRGTFAAAGLMSLAQSLGKREGAVGGAGARQVFDPAHGDERGQRLVIAQPSARLSVEMHGRRPSAGEQQRDDLVVGGGEPAGQDRPLTAVRLNGLFLDRLLDGGHGLTHPLLTSAANAAAR